MINMIIVDDNKAERQQLLNYVQRYCAQKGLLAETALCADWPALFQKVKQNEPDIVIIAQMCIRDRSSAGDAESMVSWTVVWLRDTSL